MREAAFSKLSASVLLDAVRGTAAILKYMHTADSCESCMFCAAPAAKQ